MTTIYWMHNTKVQKWCTLTYVTSILVFTFIVYIYAQRVFVIYIDDEFVTYICNTYKYVWLPYVNCTITTSKIKVIYCDDAFLYNLLNRWLAGSSVSDSGLDRCWNEFMENKMQIEWWVNYVEIKFPPSVVPENMLLGIFKMHVVSCSRSCWT